MAIDIDSQGRSANAVARRNGASAEAETLVSSHGYADPRVSCALDLGWRVAALYAGVMSYDRAPVGNGLLPTAASFPARDRLELELLATVGYVGRLDISIESDTLRRLKELAVSADAANGAVEGEFRNALRETHVWLDKQIWRNSEKEGRAYELGIMLFDTWSRIHRAYGESQQPGGVDVTGEWKDVFGGERVRYLLTLIDDLQSRLDPGAVTVVRDNVESWRDRVQERVEKGQLPTAQQPWQEVRDQAVVWRQLLSGDKQPEAYLGPQERAQVKDELTKLMWRRYRPVLACSILLLAGLVVAGVLLGGGLVTWYSDHTQTAAVAAGVVASIAAAFGISKASIVRAAHNSLRVWSELLWNRALSQVVCRETLRVDNVFPAEHTRRRRLASAARRRWRRGVARIPRRSNTGRRPAGGLS